MKKTTRRDFLRTATASGVVASVAPMVIAKKREYILQPEPTRPVSANDTMRVATIGMGIMGFGDTNLARQVPGVEIAYFADLYDGRLVHARERFGSSTPVTKDYREILAKPDIDAVIIATTDHWHVPMAVEALKAGKHVYLEKPAIHRVEQAPVLVEAAKGSGKVLQVGSQRVSSVIYHKAREMYQSGAIGKLNMIEAKMNRHSPMGAWQYTIPPDASPKTVDWDRFLGNAPKRPFDATRFFRWRNYWDYGTAIGGDLFVHLFSGIHAVLASKGPERIYSTGGIRYFNDGRDVPDIQLGMFTYPETPEHPAFDMSLQVNFADGGGGSEVFRFVGDSGVITIEDGGGVTLRQRAMRPESEREAIYGWNSVQTFANATQAQIRQEYRTKAASEPAGKPDPEDVVFRAPEGYNEQFEHFKNFFDTIRNGKPNVEDADFGVRAAAPAVLSNLSYVEKRVVSWDPNNLKMVS